MVKAYALCAGGIGVQTLAEPYSDLNLVDSVQVRRGYFSGSSHTGDLKTGTPVATLPDAWAL